ncbi:alpha/beta fold hydrolase [Streptomyces sp. NPDC005480]|uniref:esterase/lipase family protein n=1 Tax=Streptomyces sp. NPDC005480 TaxID=3154880 RepID=UPI0033A55717
MAVAGATAALGLAAFGIATNQASAAPEHKAAAAQAPDEQAGPPQQNFVAATAYALIHPTAVPAGANDWSCRPSAAHPHPVVLVHGTFENRYMNWAALSPKLKAAGYCVYALNYGGKEGGLIQATGDMAASAGQLATFVDKVRAQTGDPKVDLVGHSQGGVMPRYYIKNLGGADKVDKLVALSPTNHGTSLSGLTKFAEAIPGAKQLIGTACPACTQQIAGSDFITALNAGGETAAGVDYTVLTTKTDWVATPYTTGYLTKGDNVTQSALQDSCPVDLTEHLGISYDKTAMQIVLNALDPEHSKTPSC